MPGKPLSRDQHLQKNKKPRTNIRGLTAESLGTSQSLLNTKEIDPYVVSIKVPNLSASP